MEFTDVFWFARLEVTVFLGGLAAIIAYRLVTGDINTRYLLCTKQKDGRHEISPARVQMFLFTIWTALLYLMQVVDSLQGATPQQGVVLPDIPLKTLAALGGSHAIYLGSKAYLMMFQKIAKGE